MFQESKIRDVVDRVVGDSVQHISEVCLRVKAVQFGRANESVDRGGPFASDTGPGEKNNSAGQSLRRAEPSRERYVNYSVAGSFSGRNRPPASGVPRCARS